MKSFFPLFVLIVCSCSCGEERARPIEQDADFNVDELFDASITRPSEASIPDAQPPKDRPDASLPAEDGAVGPQCVAFEPPPRTGRCEAEAWECLLDANGDGAKVDACFAQHEGCEQCLNDHYNDCLLGTVAEPGPCQEERYCFFGCLIYECNDDDIDCLEAAAVGACDELREEARVCGDRQENQDACAPVTFDSCRPDAFCGDGRVDAGETCDGNCPTSCGTPSDVCTKRELRGSAQTCDAECVEVPIVDCCRPDCSGKTCGGDGCGGSCGSCFGAQECISGTCQCVPDCSGKSCGSDGCGGTCGSCSGSDRCVSGQCQACVPSCTGKTCGSDGCGGSCGSCAAGSSCSFGVCKVDEESCDPVDNRGCTSPNQCAILSNETTQCALLGTGTRGSFCSDLTDCRGGYACFANECRKVCDLGTGDGCFGGEICNGVSGWREFGACADP